MNLTEKQLKSFMVGLAMGRAFTTVKKKNSYYDDITLANKKPIKIIGGKNNSYIGSGWLSGGSHLLSGGAYGGTSINLFYSSYINKISGVANFPPKGYFNIYVDGVLVGKTDRFDLVEGYNQVKTDALLDIDETKRGNVSFELVIEKDGEDDAEYEVVIPDYSLVIGVETQIDRDKVGDIPRLPWFRSVVERFRITDSVYITKHKGQSDVVSNLVVVDNIGIITDTVDLTLLKLNYKRITEEQQQITDIYTEIDKSKIKDSETVDNIGMSDTVFITIRKA